MQKNPFPTRTDHRSVYDAINVAMHDFIGEPVGSAVVQRFDLPEATAAALLAMDAAGISTKDSVAVVMHAYVTKA